MQFFDRTNSCEDEMSAFKIRIFELESQLQVKMEAPREQLQMRNYDSNKLERQVTEQQLYITELKSELSSKNEEVGHIKAELIENDKRVDRMEERMGEMECQLTEKDKYIKDLRIKQLNVPGSSSQHSGSRRFTSYICILHGHTTIVIQKF